MRNIYIPLLSILLLTACKETATINVNEQEQPVSKMSMELITLKKSMPEITLQLPGELVAEQRTEIYAKLNSYVKALPVDIGDRVKKGQVLLTLDAPEIQAQVARTLAKWKSDEAQYIAIKATYHRMRKANETPGAIANDALDQITAQFLAQEAQVAASKAAHREMQEMQNYLVITAPYDGVVTARTVDLGAYVGPMHKTPLLIVEQTDQLRLKVSISEENTPFVHLGDSVQFTVRTLPQHHFSGQIVRKSQSLDKKLRAEDVEIDFDNSTQRLKPNMIAEVKINLAAKEPSFFVPKSAVVDSNLGIYIIETKQGNAVHHSVKKGRTNAMMIEVFGEIEEGMILLKKASEEIANNTKLTN